MSFLNEIILEGKIVKLIPVKMNQAAELITAASDGNLWNLWYTSIPTPDGMIAYIKKAILDFENDQGLAFVVIDQQSKKIIGCTRYTNVSPEDRRVEIGYTWYAKSFQKTGVNTECKYLMLTHAFEILDCIAVEFRTNWFNHVSRAAILRLGAKQDGILRNHKIMPDGTYRDTVVFSIIKNEWPTTKTHLEYKMKQNVQLQ